MEKDTTRIQLTEEMEERIRQIVKEEMGKLRMEIHKREAELAGIFLGHPISISQTEEIPLQAP